MKRFEPNTTQVPNFVFDLLPELNETELKLFLIVIRKTYGWHKASDKIAGSQMSAMTGCGLTALKRARRSLEAKGLLKVKRGQGRDFTVYYRPEGSPEDAESGHERPRGRVAKDPGVGSPAHPTKETTQKPPHKKESVVVTSTPDTTEKESKHPSSSRPEEVTEESILRDLDACWPYPSAAMKIVSRPSTMPANLHDAFRGAV